MDIVAADLSGKTKDDDDWFNRTWDTYATGMRLATLMWGAKVVRYNSLTSFAGRVLKASDGSRIDSLCVVDHGYLNVGHSYDSDITGETHNWAMIEFGTELVGHHNFDRHKGTFGILSPVLARGSRVVFLNCLVGRDPALLYRFAELWGCRVTGSTVLQSGAEFVNMWTGEWVTVHPDKRYERTTTHPLYGTTGTGRGPGDPKFFEHR